MPAQPSQASHPQPVCHDNALWHPMYGLEGVTQASCIYYASSVACRQAPSCQRQVTLGCYRYTYMLLTLPPFWCPGRSQAASSCLHTLGARGCWSDSDITGLEGSTSSWRHEQPHSGPWYPWAEARPVPRSHPAAGGFRQSGCLVGAALQRLPLSGPSWPVSCP